MAWLSKPANLILVGIILAGILFRFYNTPARFGFDQDPTRDALLALYATSHFTPIPLTGPPSGIAAFTFGPWYYYELFIFTFLVPSIYAPFYFIPVFSIAFIVLMYFIGRELRDKILGLILAGLASFSPSQIGPTAGLSNPNLVGPHAAASVLLFILYCKGKTNKWMVFTWGLVMGLGINHHFELIPLLLLPPVAFIYGKKNILKNMLLFGFSVLLTFIPFLLLNFFADWHTVTGIQKYIQSGGSAQYIPNSWTIYLKDFWPPFWSYVLGVVPMVGIVLAIGVGLIHMLLGYQKKLSTIYLLLLGIFFLMIGGLRYFNAQRDYYYFIFLHPFIFLVAGQALRALWDYRYGKVLMVGVCVLLFLSAWPMNLQRLNPRKDQQLFKANTARLLTIYPENQLEIYNCRDVGINRAQGIVFFLQKANLTSSKLTKIAVKDEIAKCALTKDVEEIIKPGIYDASLMTQQELTQNGWELITPEATYQKTILWWEKNDE